MKPFELTGAARPGRSHFDLSHDHKTTCDMGQLVPMLAMECVPGDFHKISNALVIRFQPMIAPVLHEINAFMHYFFVPYRLLWDDWDKYLSGGKDGDFSDPLPRWEVTGDDDDNAVGSLWDYLDNRIGVVPTGAFPHDLHKRAYNLVYNEFYRDENLIDEIDIETSESVLLRAWEKDYFTSSLPWLQRGDAPALPITGTGSAVFSTPPGLTYPGVLAGTETLKMKDAAGSAPGTAGSKALLESGTVNISDLNLNEIDFSTASTFDVNDMRRIVQIQRWLERNARGGVRYTEFLRAHYGVSPRDERLQRPEYLGGSRSPVIVSEVLQTGESGSTPQGNMAGHGITADGNFICKYHVEEFGVILGILSVMPRPAYQQGIPRGALRTSRYDWFDPLFVNLSEQAILQAELYATGVDAENNTVVGYQGRYDELRKIPSRVSGLMRSDAATSLHHWHLARDFDSAPVLGRTFIECDGSDLSMKRIFAATDEPGLIVNLRSIIDSYRPLPIMAMPGRMDH